MTQICLNLYIKVPQPKKTYLHSFFVIFNKIIVTAFFQKERRLEYVKVKMTSQSSH